MYLAAGYKRVSTGEQAEQGHSLDDQGHSIQAFVQAREWSLVKIYTDAGESGTRTDRPALEELLADAERNLFEVVVVHSVDRFFRNLEGLLKALNRLQAAGVAFVSISENLDFTTPWGKLALAVLGTLAEIYIDRLSADTSRGKQARARKGLWNGSIPLGYCNGLCTRCTDPNGPGYCIHVGGEDRGDGKVLVSHPIESVAVRLAYEWYATGNYSDGDIAAKLNAYRHELSNGDVVHFRSKRFPARGGPGPIGKDSVRSMLTRLFYTGVVPYYGVDEKGRKRKKPVVLHPGRHAALVPHETFDRCQELRQLKYRAPQGGRIRRPARVYPLSQLLRCGQCGGPMRGQAASNNRKRYYICVTRMQKQGDCTQQMVAADIIEGATVDFLINCRLPADWQERVNQLLRPELSPEERQARVEALRERKSRAAELYLDGDIDKGRYAAEKESIQKELVYLCPGESSAIIDAGHTLQQFEQLWSESTHLKKKKLLRVVLSAAFVRGLTLSGVTPNLQFYPLIHLGATPGFYNGSDGIRTRDLRLDRPAC